MADKPRKSRFKTALTYITFVALVFLAYAVRQQIYDTFHNIREVNTLAVLLIIPLEMLNNLAQGKLYQGLFGVIGQKFRTRSMFRLSFELNFVNSIFPSGGVSGFSYLSLRMRRENVSTAQATVVQMMRFVLIFVSFQIMLVVGLIALAIGGQANDFILLISGSIVTFLVILTTLIAYIIGSKERIDTFFTAITKVLNLIIHQFRRKNPETFNISSARSTFNDFHENYMHIRRNLFVLKRPLLYALLANLTEVAAVYVVYIAFGKFVNPGAVILGYAVANFAGLVSVLPGGVGVYEGLMTAVQSAGGIPAALSLPVTIMYRVVNMSAQLPIGYYFYQKALRTQTSFDPDKDLVKPE